MKTLLALAFGATLCLALLLLTLQFFLTPAYLEMEYEFVGFPSPHPLSGDQRYIAAQSFLSYLNVEIGGATLLALSQLQFGNQLFFNEDDLGCILRAKEVRGAAFGLTFLMGAVTIALWLFMAVDDFDWALRVLITAAAAGILIYTALSLLTRFFFPSLVPLLLNVVTTSTCVATQVRGFAQIFPSMIFYDGLILMFLFTRMEAAIIMLSAWLAGALMHRVRNN